MRTPITITLLLLLLCGCGLFESSNTQPLTDAITAMDAEFQKQQIASRKLIEFGENNGMSQAVAGQYRFAFDDIGRAFDRIRYKALAAVAELGQVPLSEILASAETAVVTFSEPETTTPPNQ